MTRLHFKHQSECDLLEDMRYEHICITDMCWQLSPTAKRVEEYTRHLPHDSKSSDRCWLWCACCARMDAGKGPWVWEGWHGREKEEEEEEYCHFSVLGEGQRVMKMTKEFPADLFLLSDRFFLLFRISLFISVIFSLPRFLFSASSALTVFFCRSPYLCVSFWLSFVYSWRAWSWQFSLSVLAKGGSPGSFAGSHFCVDWNLIISDNKPHNALLLCLRPRPSPCCLILTLSLLSRRRRSRSSLLLPSLTLGAAPAVWEQIALLLLGFREWTRPWSHWWESGRASLACATATC